MRRLRWPRSPTARSAATALAALAAVVAAGSAAALPRLPSRVPWEVASGVPSVVPTLAAAAHVPPRGAYHGWVAPGAARVWLEASPCQAGDPPLTLTLALSPGRVPVAGLAGDEPGGPTPHPVSGVALDLAAGVPRAPAAAPPEAVLDVGPALAEALLGPAAGAAAPHPIDTPHARARVVCRSWRERAWDVGALAVARVDGAATDDLPLRAYLVPEPAHTGVVAVVLLQALAEPVEVRGLAYAPAAVASGRVLAAVGAAEHWPEWRRRARAAAGSAAPEAAASAAGTSAPEPPRPHWLAPGPTPPLRLLPADDLGLRIEPFGAALVAIGDWSFRPAGALSPPPLRWLARALDRLRPPRPGDTLPPRLLSFPSLTYAHAGEARSVGFLEPLRLAPGSSTTRAARAARACGFLC